MTDPWYTTNLTLAISLFAAAVIARLARWITRRTFAALWGLAIALNTTRALAQERYVTAAACFGAVLLMAWVWWTERPAPTDRGDAR